MKGNGEALISIVSYRFNYNTAIEKSPPFPICNEKNELYVDSSRHANIYIYIAMGLAKKKRKQRT